MPLFNEKDYINARNYANYKFFTKILNEYFHNPEKAPAPFNVPGSIKMLKRDWSDARFEVNYDLIDKQQLGYKDSLIEYRFTKVGSMAINRMNTLLVSYFSDRNQDCYLSNELSKTFAKSSKLRSEIGFGREEEPPLRWIEEFQWIEVNGSYCKYYSMENEEVRPDGIPKEYLPDLKLTQCKTPLLQTFFETIIGKNMVKYSIKAGHEIQKSLEKKGKNNDIPQQYDQTNIPNINYLSNMKYPESGINLNKIVISLLSASGYLKGYQFGGESLKYSYNLYKKNEDIMKHVS